MTMRSGWWIAVALLVAGGPARADDPWEAGTGDDASTTSANILRHAEVQRGHDLQGIPSAPDQDWMTFRIRNRHSYEVRVSGVHWDAGCGLPACPRFDRVTAAGLVLTAGTATNEDYDRGISSAGRTVRWMEDWVGAPDGTAFLRAIGDELLVMSAAPYDVVLYDTTLFVPRFNNSGSQSTVLVLQNTTNVMVVGSIFFHDAAGAWLETYNIAVPPHGVSVIATAAVPALAGRSGSAQIAHLGGYEALAGKAVALEPATGFTFDTPITAIPR
jgi:hypothetical protein